MSTPLKLWYYRPEDAAKAAVRLLGLSTRGNAGGWLYLYEGDVEVWHGHGYYAAWPFLMEGYREQLSPLPLIGPAYVRKYVCAKCGFYQSVKPADPVPEKCKCDKGPVHMCGCCRWSPALPDRLVCETCSQSERLMEWWEPKERALRDRELMIFPRRGEQDPPSGMA